MNFKPNKTLGQNFLVDKRMLAKIIAAANLTKESMVVEIGPGTGTLTQALAQYAKKVIAIEKDPRMVAILKQTMDRAENVEIIEGDALKIINDQFSIIKTAYTVVANLPYYITSPVIRMFLEAENPPQEMILMVQKEVAQRICAKPHNMSLLAVSVQYYAEPKIISYVSRGSFWPAPTVDSAIIKIIPRNSASTSAQFREAFFKVVKAGFSQPRKQLAGNLAKELNKSKEEVATWLSNSGVNPTQRAETLSVQDWEKLANTCG